MIEINGRCWGSLMMGTIRFRAGFVAPPVEGRQSGGAFEFEVTFVKVTRLYDKVQTQHRRLQPVQVLRHRVVSKMALLRLRSTETSVNCRAIFPKKRNWKRQDYLFTVDGPRQIGGWWRAHGRAVQIDNVTDGVARFTSPDDRSLLRQLCPIQVNTNNTINIVASAATLIEYRYSRDDCCNELYQKIWRLFLIQPFNRSYRI